MPENVTDKKRCGVCHQSFNSDQELEQHYKSSHPQTRGGDTHPGSNYPQGNPEMQKNREKIKIAS